MSTRYANEKKFKQWKDGKDGARLYWKRVEGKKRGYAFYYKEVDANEQTLRLWQEVYNEQNELIEIHHKYPVDTGHQKIKKP